VRPVLNSWGPGNFDAELLLDGKAFRPDGKPAATLTPPAFGLAGINLHTWTGWGSVPHWNALVANLEMRGKGNFDDSRLDDAAQFPIAAANHFGHPPFQGLGSLLPYRSSDVGSTKFERVIFRHIAAPDPQFAKAL
jgi:hypothetical protein